MARQARRSVLDLPGEHDFRTNEAADALGVHPNTIRNMLKDGRIGDWWITPGGQARIPSVEINRLLIEGPNNG